MVLAYIICKNEAEALRISNHLLKKRLIACANLFPIRSLYRWKGKPMDDKEVAVLAKTVEKKFSAVRKEVEKMHSYEVPCILKLQAQANAIYERWVEREV